jgi:hypothetical protein
MLDAPASNGAGESARPGTGNDHYARNGPICGEETNRENHANQRADSVLLRLDYRAELIIAAAISEIQASA